MELEKSPLPPSIGGAIALLFFEPSTRTRMSFEAAAYRVGLGPMVFDGGHRTSLEKGESVEDSILNVAAMQPKILVVRCGDELNLKKLSESLDVPVVNAGWGVVGHPTQALLDVMTLQKSFANLEGLRILFVGDIAHSRVAASHFELLPKLGVQHKVCAPDEFLNKVNAERVSSLTEGLQWADAVVALRVQFERHNQNLSFSSKEYQKAYCINQNHLRMFPELRVLHPGPINQNLEIESEVLKAKNSLVYEQVKNGVYIREAILRAYLGGGS